jgi:hypothetical protein
MLRFEAKLTIRSAQISMKLLKDNIIKKLTKTELRAMPLKLLLSATLILCFLGMGIIELAPNPEGAQPCTIILVKRKAIKHAKSDPA